MQTRAHDALARHVGEVEQIVVLLLRGQNGSLGFGWQKWLARFGVSIFSRNGNQFFFGITQCRELSAENAAGINVDGAVQPFRFGHRRMPINHHRRPAIFSRPIVAHRQSKLVGFAGRLPEQRELPHCARAAPLHGFLHASVGDDELAIIEDIMAHEFVDEICGNPAEATICLLVCLKLCERFRQTMRDLNVLAPDFAHELHVMIAWHAQRRPRIHGFQHQPNHVGNFWPAINQVADKHELAPFRMFPSASRLLRVTQLAEQFDEFIKAAMHVANDVERPMLPFQIVP